MQSSVMNPFSSNWTRMYGSNGKNRINTHAICSGVGAPAAAVSSCMYNGVR